MAIGNITLVKREYLGSSNLTINTLDLDTSYPTNGYPLTPAQLGVGTNLRMVVAQAKNGIVFEYDYVNSKLKAFWTGAVVSTALAEVTNTTNLSTVTGVRVMALGN